MGLRRLGRELALKALYQIDVSGDSSTEAVARMLAGGNPDERARRFALELIDGVCREQNALDKQIADTLEHWSLGRLSRIDHCILRLALHELIGIEDIPARVTIDEAIELAKRYGDQESGRFVNGVLDRLAERLGLKGKGDGSYTDEPE